ncbi:MAG: hypothetical protein D6766_14010 [Verrucomicrobia bacterium]|nr:MAG: hypothetical protein D6766_14010 [Verrucomicrobiota bacterium]
MTFVRIWRSAARRLWLAGGLLLPLAAASTEPRPPAIDWLFPAGARVGTEQLLHLGGSWPGWPIQGWAAADGVHLTPDTEPGRFRVRVDETASPGPTLLRFFNEAGATPPLQFFIEDADRFLIEPPEDSTNAGPARPLITGSTAVVYGRLLRPEETDPWPVAVARPALLAASLVARGLDSPLRARLTLLGPEAGPLAESKTTGSTEPSLAAHLATPGLYVLQVAPMEGQDAFATNLTGPEAIYRLRLAITPTNSFGRYLPAEPPLSPDIQRSLLHSNLLEPGQERVAFIDVRGDVDLYGVDTRWLERLEAELETGVWGPPFTARLRLLDPAGALVAEQLGESITLDWVAEPAGLYQLEVTEAQNRGDPTWSYRIAVRRQAIRVRATVSADRLRLQAGETARLELQLDRPPGENDVFAVRAEGLPPGVTAGQPLLVPGLSRVAVDFRAAPDAAPHNGPFRLVLSTINLPLPADLAAEAVVPGRHAPSETLLVPRTTDLWLTVSPAEPAP